MKTMRSRSVTLLLLVVALGPASLVASAADQPRPTVKLPTALIWMLNAGGRCPDCDAAQTWVGRKETPLPSPLPANRTNEAGARTVPTAAEPNPLDAVSWEQIRLLLPEGFRR
jgi:hypothetical protein